MCRTASRHAPLWTACGVAVLTVLLGAGGLTGAETINGKIKSFDPDSGRLSVRPIGATTERTFQLKADPVISGLQKSHDRQGLAVGQLIKLFVEPGTGAVEKLVVVMAAASPDAAEPAPAHANRPLSTPAGWTDRSRFNRRYGLSVAPARSVEATLTFAQSYPKVNATEWVVFAPHAPELPGQMNVQSSLSPGGMPTWDLSPSHRPLLMARLPGDSRARQSTVSVRVEYRSTLLERHLYERSPGAEVDDAIPLGTTERSKALARGGVFELEDPRFRRWLNDHHLTMKPAESEVDFARRVFLTIRRGFTYEFRDGMDRRVSHVCTAGRSDCGGLSILFAAALRTQEVPARVLVGRWARSAEPGAQLGGLPYHQWHVKAEFYAEGVGWIPVDLAASLESDHSSEGLAYFGHDEGDFLTLHVDPDLVFDTVHFGPQRHVFINGGLAVWVMGTGSLTGSHNRQDWQVRERESSSRLDRVADSLRSSRVSR